MTEETLFFNGKKYISSRRASEISSYSIDYLGQLSRKGILESEMVGRNRYVSEFSLLNYLNEKSNKSKKEFAHRKLSRKEESSETDQEKNKKAPIEASGPAEEKARSQTVPFKVSENKPAELQSFGYALKEEKDFSVNTKKHSPDFKKQLTGSVLVVALMFLFLNLPIAKDGFNNFLSALSLNTDNSVEIDNSYIVPTSTKIVKENKNIEVIEALQSVDRSFIGVLEKVDNAVISFFRRLRRNTVNVIVWVKEKIAPEKETKIVFTSEENVSKDSDGEEGVSSVTQEELRKIVRQILLDENDIFVPGGPYGGIVTNPSGSPEEDADFVQRVEDTFSDEVRVQIDDSRSFGRVRPVFRNAEEANDEYLFVFVPVNE